eukprot:754753-Hanusia_phi.AAC.4
MNVSNISLAITIKHRVKAGEVVVVPAPDQIETAGAGGGHEHRGRDQGEALYHRGRHDRHSGHFVQGDNFVSSACVRAADRVFKSADSLPVTTITASACSCSSSCLISSLSSCSVLALVPALAGA